MVAELPGAATAKAMSRPEQKETGEVFEEANGGQSEASELMAGGPLPMASVAGGPVPFSQLFVPGGVQQTTPFVGGLQQVMPFLPVGGPMQSNSYVFGASMSPGGFAAPMSPAFGDARGGLVAGTDPVVTEVEPGSACAGRVQEPPETVEEINVDVPPERREDGVRTPRKRQAEQEVFIGTPERGPEPRSSRVRQVHSPSEVQGMPSMPSMPVGMRGSSSVPVGSRLINAPWISTQGGTTFGVTSEVWQQMQQQSVPQQPVRPQPDPLMMFMQQQSQQNALMMQQMMQMTTAVVQALNGLSAGAPPGGGKGGVSGGPSGGGPPAGASFGGVSSSGHGGGGSSTSFPAEGKMPFNVNLPVCAWREWNTRYKELVGF